MLLSKLFEASKNQEPEPKREFEMLKVYHRSFRNKHVSVGNTHFTVGPDGVALVPNVGYTMNDLRVLLTKPGSQFSLEPFEHQKPKSKPVVVEEVKVEEVTPVVAESATVQNKVEIPETVTISEQDLETVTAPVVEAGTNSDTVVENKSVKRRIKKTKE
jgi:hypothetical protein